MCFGLNFFVNYISQKTPPPAGQPLPSAVGHGSIMKGKFSGIIHHITLISLDAFGSAVTPHSHVIISAKETRVTWLSLGISGL